MNLIEAQKTQPKKGRVKGLVTARSEQYSSIKIKTEKGEEAWINNIPEEYLAKYTTGSKVELEVQQKNNKLEFLEEVSYEEPEETQTFSSYLDKAHKMGIKEIKTEIIEYNPAEQRAVFKAVVKLQDGRTFTGYGDASQENTTTHMQRHFLRFAETRAIARALRFATNEGRIKTGESNG